jgi:hypothetical protein
MADNTIELLIKATDQASAQIGDIKDSVSGLGDAMKALVPLAASLGVAFSLRGVIDQIIDAQASMAQLNAAFASTGATLGLTRDQLTHFTESITQNTVASKVQVQEAESVLLTFNKVRGDGFERTIQAASDLSARFGIDLVSATRLLGRALEEPVAGMNSLRRMGVVLSDSQKDLIKNFHDVGDEAGAVDVILSHIEKNFHGAADAAANTLGGALKQLKNAAAELFDLDAGTTGGLIDSIKELKTIIADPELKAGIQSIGLVLTDTLGIGVKAVSELIETIQGLDLILNGQQGENQFVNLDIQIDQLTAKIETMKDNSAFSLGFADPAQKQLLASLNAQLEELKAKQDALNSPAADATSGGSKTQKPISDDALNAMIKTQDDAYKELAKGATGVLEAIDEALSAVGFKTMEEIDKINTANETATETSTEKIRDKYAILYSQLDALASQGLNRSELINREASLIAEETIAEQTDALKELGKTGTESAAELTKEFETIRVELGKETVGILTPKQTEEQKKAIKDIQNVFAGLFENMNEGVAGFLKNFLGAIEKIVAEAAAASAVKYLFGSPETKQADGTTSAATSGILSGVSKYFGFASGGTTSSSGVVNVGETGPEKVLLPQGARVYNSQQWQNSGLGGGGGDVNFSPTYQIAISAADADKTRAELMSYVDFRSQSDRSDLYRTLNRNGFGTMR